ncbi:IPT/TIG domain-containing protein [Niveibacterium sp.]|uniref:IPT/TIG domain-containing protein n=1 Tax=Niveibacterium sp. TaxID=2017444 RepID=UPI0035B254A4
MSLHYLRVFLLLIPFIAACGGGGGSTPSTPPPPAPSAVTIAGFSPDAAGAGGLVTLTGSGFRDVTSVSIGGVAANFIVLGDTQLAVIVPAAAIDGAIQLNSRSGAVQTASSLKVSGEAAIEGIAPTFVKRGSDVTLSGTGMEGISAVRVGGVAASIISQSPTRMVLTVPAQALGGVIEIINASGKAIPLAQTLSFDATIVLDGFEPTEAPVGASITLHGSGLLDVSSVRIGNVAADLAPGRTDTTLVLTVPPGAGSGPLTVLGAASPLLSAIAFRVIPTITISTAAPLAGIRDTLVSIKGSGLDAVSSITIGGEAMKIISQSPTAIAFLAGQSGEVVLNGAGAQRVVVGSFAVTAGAVPTVTVARIDVGQNFSQPVGSPLQQLVPGKAALLRAYVLNANALPSPAVTASVLDRTGALLGSIKLQGPSRLPTDVDAKSLGTSFNATLPAAWVQAGMAVTVNVSSEQPYNSGASNTVRPAVGAITELKVMLVPLIALNQRGQLVTGVVPSVEAVKARLARTYPVAPEHIQVAVRTPYLMSQSGRSFASADLWDRGLGEVEALRSLEKPDWNYFGLVPRESTNGTNLAGLGYMPVLNDETQQSAIGYDDSPGRTNSLDVMVHEIGHNKSRGHAPCGAVSFLDLSWPTDTSHLNAALGPSPLIDPATQSLVTYVTHGADDTDIMGYCQGLWFSDHNYAAIQRFLEQRPVAAMQARSVPFEQILVRGRIADGVVTLAPISVSLATQAYAGTGDWTLRLYMADGQVTTQRFSVATLPDLTTDTAYFSLTLPRTGEIVKLEVLHGDRILPLKLDMPPVAAARDTGDAIPAEGPRIDWTEHDGQLDLRWNADRYPAVQVLHLGAIKTVLATQLSGGTATLPLTGIPAGGEFVFSLSNGFDARRIVVARKQ